MRHQARPLSALLAAAAGVAWAACAGGASPDPYADRLARMHRADRPAPSPAVRSASQAGVTAREVSYGTAGGEELTGYLATPEDADASTPGLLVIHEWWGLNDNIRTMTRMLAARGYVALAVDLYGDRVTDRPSRARELVGEVMNRQERALANLSEAHRWLEERGSARIGVIGWCFGGSWSLRTALHLPEKIDAAVVYYGQPVTDVDRLSTLTMPLLGHFGAEDGSIPVSEVEAFGRALSEAGVTHRVHVYEGAGHAFANPSGTRYVERAARTAWDRTVAFLAEHLKGGEGEGS